MEGKIITLERRGLLFSKRNEQDFVGIVFSSFLTENGDLVESSDWDVNTNYMDDDSQGNSNMDVHMSKFP